MVFIRIKDKETGRESKEVSINDIIFHQSRIAFEFGEMGDDDYERLPYDDFLFFSGDYQVIIRIEKGNKDEGKVYL